MKKNILIFVLALLVVAVAASAVLAATTAKNNTEKISPVEQCKELIAQSVKEGKMTSEQAKAMEEHMDVMGPHMNGMMKNMMGSQGMMGAGASGHCPVNTSQNTN